MSNFSSSALRRAFVMQHSSLLALPQSSGTPTLTTAKLMPDSKVTLTPGNELVEADYKTGTGSMLAGISGRKGPCSFSIEAPIHPSGAAGTQPDMDPLLGAIFGALGSVLAGVSTTYSCVDTFSYLAIFLFDLLSSTLTQEWAFGCVPTDATINIGGNGYLKVTVNGKGVYLVFSDNFANEDATAKAGYTSVPTVPGSPSIAGNMILPITSTCTFGGSAVSELRSATISIATGKSLRADAATSLYPDAAVQGRRKIQLRSLKIMNSDSAALTTVKNAAFNKTALDVVFAQGGGVAGYILTHTLKQVQFGNAQLVENGDGLDVEFDDSPAHASALASTNDYQIVNT